MEGKGIHLIEGIARRVRSLRGHSPYPDKGYYDIPEQYVREVKPYETRPLGLHSGETRAHCLNNL